MKPLYIMAVLLGFALLSSCHKALPAGSEQAVLRFNVQSVDGISTKSLVDSYSQVELSCTPVADGGGGKSIGIWADSQVGGLPQENIFPGTRLIYKEKPGGHSGHTGSDAYLNKWNYDGDDLYWSAGAAYKFRAYYPYEEINPYVNASLANADHFYVSYNSSLLQTDMLMAYTYVNTSLTGKIGGHVDLHLKHMLAGLQFQFIFKDGYKGVSDRITSCWLENVAAEEASQWSAMGVLIYGISDTDVSEDKITWSYPAPVSAGTRMYYWAASPGQELERNSANVQTKTAIAYDPSGVSAGSVFTENDHYVLIVPQPCHANATRLCFTMQGGGSSIYSVMLPGELGYTEDGIKKTSYAYEPGKLYTFTIVISETNLDLLLTIKPWNRIESSHAIEF